MTNKELWSEIVKANSEINTMELTHKKKDEFGNWIKVTNQYCEVKERVIAFRKVYPHGTIETIQTKTDHYIEYKAIIKDGDVVLADGDSREKANVAYALEIAQTSAIGRALGYAGFGISTSIASADEVQRLNDDEVFDVDVKPKGDLIKEFNSLYSANEKAQIMNILGVTEVEDLETNMLETYIRKRKNG